MLYNYACCLSRIAQMQADCIDVDQTLNECFRSISKWLTDDNLHPKYTKEQAIKKMNNDDDLLFLGVNRKSSVANLYKLGIQKITGHSKKSIAKVNNKPYGGGCVTSDTSVMTLSGAKIVSELSIDDYLLSIDEKNQAFVSRVSRLEQHLTNVVVSINNAQIKNPWSRRQAPGP